MEKENTLNSKKIYFPCLGLYHTTFSYDVNQGFHNEVSSSLAIKVGSLLTNKYEILQLIKEDSFGFTYLVKEIANNKQYLVKEFFPKIFVVRNDKNQMIMKVSSDIDKLTTFNYMQNFFTRESNNLEKLSTLSHPNIICVHRVMKNINNTTYIFYPYHKGKTLKVYLEEKEDNGEKLNTEEINIILHSLLNAVEHLHALNITHLNITAENIFIRDDGVLILLGFEASTFFYDQYSDVYCNGYTPYTAAPEQIDTALFSEINESSDIYAIAVILYKMITGLFPPESKKRIDSLANKITDDPYHFLSKEEEFFNEDNSFLLSSVDKALAFSSNDRFKNIEDFKLFLQEGPSSSAKGLITKKNILLLLSFISIVLFLIFFDFTNNINEDEARVEEMQISDNKSMNIEKKKINILKDIQKEDNKSNLSNNPKKMSTIVELQIEEKNINMEENVTENSLGTIKIQEQEVEIDSEFTKDIEIENITKSESEEDNKNNLSNDSRKISTIVELQIEEKNINMEENVTENSLGIIKEQEKNIDDYFNEDIEVKSIIIRREKKVEDLEVFIPSNASFMEDKLQNLVDETESKKLNIGIIDVDDNQTILRQVIPKTEVKRIKLKPIIIKDKRSTKNKFTKQKKKLKRKKKIKRKTVIQRKNSSGLVWYCKATAGNIRTSAKSSDKARSKNMALAQCRKRAGSKKHCRILNCFLLR